MDDLLATKTTDVLDVDATSAKGHDDAPANRQLGVILVDRGRLTTQDVVHVLQAQKENGLRFGDAAILLGMLTRDDIRQALSHQFNYPYLSSGDITLDESLVAAYQPFSPPVEDLRALRSQLLLRWFDAGTDRKTLAIVSPGAREGRSHIVANLAIVFSQLGERTLVVDADLRRPRQHRLFRLANKKGLSDILLGRCGAEAVVRMPSLHRLSVLPAGATPPNPQELLGRARFSSMLHALYGSYDVIILDTPASAEFADANVVAARSEAAVLVTRRHVTSLAQAGRLVRNLQEYGVSVVGSVLNRG